MIKSKTGDLLQSRAEALVNPVNCVGVMGKGLALQFKKKYPFVFDAYRRDCLDGLVKPGVMGIHPISIVPPPRFVINFPTKRDWRESSRMEDIEAGLTSLAHAVQRLKLQSIAIPQLGCGLGGLLWSDVRPKIEKIFAPLDGVDIFLYEG